MENYFKNIDYSNCITNLTSSIQKYYGLKPNYKTINIVDKLLNEKEYKNVIVFVFDAMGSAIIDKNTTSNHFLRTHKIADLKATYPPTTANCTTAFVTGLNPIETGWLGWATYFKDLNLCIDNFPNVESLTKKSLLEEKLAYKKMPITHLGKTIEEKTNGNVKYYTFMPFNENSYKSLKHLENRLINLCNQDHKKYIYVYYDEPDACMHIEGTASQNVKKHLNNISKLLNHIQRKTKDTIGFVSADHGQVDVIPIAFYTYYEILDCLYAPFSCDSRTCFFFVKEDKKNKFVQLFNNYFKNMYDLYSKEEILKYNIFGPGQKYPNLDNILGDYIAIAKDKYYFLLTPESHLFKGHHAGILKDEMEIPLIVIKN